MLAVEKPGYLFIYLLRATRRPTWAAVRAVIFNIPEAEVDCAVRYMYVTVCVSIINNRVPRATEPS